jgi:hypothetical protein
MASQVVSVFVLAYVAYSVYRTPCRHRRRGERQLGNGATRQKGKRQKAEAQRRKPKAKGKSSKLHAASRKPKAEGEWRNAEADRRRL